MLKPIVLAIQNDETDPPHLAGIWLAEIGCEIQVVHAYRGESVPALVPANIAAIMPLGGHMGANDDSAYSFLTNEKLLLADAIARDIPVLAICLGAQLLAVAGGGTVSRAAEAEIGIYKITLNDAGLKDSVLKLGTSALTAQWHEDVVTEIPVGATLLASSPLCENQIFRMGSSIYAFQSHPELDASIISAWEGNPDNAFLDSGKSSVESEVAKHEEELKRTWKPVIQSCGKLLLK